MRTPLLKPLAILVALGIQFLGSPQADAARSEENLLKDISDKLQPIDDSMWNEIAGQHQTETYEIQKGDSLWNVSKRLFGNAYYWPKIWSLNSTIANPHVVSPGDRLAFVPGSSQNVPQLGPEGSISLTTSSDANQPLVRGKGHHEYEKVPSDKWAPQGLNREHKEQYDDFGLDKELKIEIPSRFNFRLPVFANESTIPYLGEIVGSPRDGVGLSQHEVVFVKSPNQDLQVGSSYSVLSEPDSMKYDRLDRNGFLYTAKGTIRILGVKDATYIAEITNAYDVILRGDRIYPLMPEISEIKPLPASTSIESLILFSKIMSTSSSAQTRFVHLDRGLEDGVVVGNIFRIYQYNDPHLKKKLTDNDMLLKADVIVVHATAQFSTALVLKSRDTIQTGDFGVSLTDVTEYTKPKTMLERTFDDDERRSAEDKELDELDALDRKSGEGLGQKEQQEIKELDKWDKTKDLPQNTEAPKGDTTDTSAVEQPKTQEAGGEQLVPLDSTPETPTISEPSAPTGNGELPTIESSTAAPPSTPPTSTEPAIEPIVPEVPSP